MSITAPSRRLATRCIFCSALPIRVRESARRTFIQSNLVRARGGKDEDDGPSRPNPFLEEYQRRHGAQTGEGQQGQQQPKPGDLAASSIFEDDLRVQQQVQQQTQLEEEGTQVGGRKRDPKNMQRVLDPDPNARERYERKKVIQMVRRGGRLNRVQFLKRTERAHLVKSHNMKTSVKKLGMLARQIAGKTLDDAITQMRFSRKKVAQDVLKQLELARDEAIVMRGMGLGNVVREEGANNLNNTSALITGTTTPAAEKKKAGEPIEIQLKDGKRHLVDDRSKIYIDQAWVGRGPYGQLPDYRARGRLYIMRTPFTSISLLLKEETTRVREYEERETKRKRKIWEKPWIPLPDRPIQTARQWYSW